MLVINITSRGQTTGQYVSHLTPAQMVSELIHIYPFNLLIWGVLSLIVSDGEAQMLRLLQIIRCLTRLQLVRPMISLMLQRLFFKHLI